METLKTSIASEVTEQVIAKVNPWQMSVDERFKKMEDKFQQMQSSSKDIATSLTSAATRMAKIQQQAASSNQPQRGKQHFVVRWIAVKGWVDLIT